MFITALTVSVVHQVVEHERGVCEVCLHSQANDDFDVNVTVTLVFQTQNHEPNAPISTIILPDTFSPQDSIRAPPLYV